MLLLIVGLALFLGTHAFTMARGPRAALIDRVGEGPYKIGYSLVALAGLILTGIGYGQYRAHGYIEVWSPPVWTRHLALLLVLLAFISFAAAYLPGRIKARLKHPMLLGVKIWATAHLLANGDLGSIILFGSFLGWAVYARIAAKKREAAGGITRVGMADRGWANDAIAVGLGTVLYLALAYVFHPAIIGVPVFRA